MTDNPNPLAALLAGVPRLVFTNYGQPERFIKEADVLAALTLPDDEAGKVLERLRGRPDMIENVDRLRDEAADLIKRILAQRAADAARIREAVKMLDEKDREYNRLTNDMIERHAARIRELEAERDKSLEQARMNSFAGEGYVYMQQRAEAAEAKLAEWQASQHYSYIGKDGKPVLARDLEARAEEAEARNAAMEAERDEAFRRRDAWKAKADGYDELAAAVRAKVKAEPATMSRVLLKAALIDADKRNAALAAQVERMRGASIETYYARQVEWSRETFGPALRTKGIIDHITKELREIAADPHDLSEWIDVVILAMDGFWRHGGKPEDLMPALLAKQAKNMARTWPDWRGMSEDAAIEHDRSKDAALTTEADNG